MRQVSPFDLAGLREQIAEMSKAAEAPDFWNDQEKGAESAQKA